jgi:hypothetical protein
VVLLLASGAALWSGPLSPSSTSHAAGSAFTTRTLKLVTTTPTSPVGPREAKAYGAMDG